MDETLNENTSQRAQIIEDELIKLQQITSTTTANLNEIKIAMQKLSTKIDAILE